MSTRIQNTLRLLGKQIHDLRVPGLPRWNSKQRPEATWAKVISSYQGLPEPYRESISSLLTAGQAFPYTILTPSYETFRTRVHEKLVCAMEREVYVLERSDNVVTTVCYPIHEIWYVEVSSMLLDYRVKIHGLTNERVPASSIFRCSTATDYVFMPLLKKIRLREVSSQSRVETQTTTPFDQWSHLNYKFMNFARNSLLGGEKVVCAILQPEIKSERFRILGRTYYRTISPTHTCVLTDRELILIREEALQDRQDKYGGIWDFIPLNKIESLSVSRRNGTLLVLRVRLCGNEEFECLFQESKKGEVDRLASQVHELTSG